LNTGGHQPVQITAHRKQLAPDTIGGSSCFTFCSHASLQKLYPPFEQPPRLVRGSCLWRGSHLTTLRCIRLLLVVVMLLSTPAPAANRNLQPATLKSFW